MIVENNFTLFSNMNHIQDVHKRICTVQSFVKKNQMTSFSHITVLKVSNLLVSAMIESKNSNLSHNPKSESIWGYILQQI